MHYIRFLKSPKIIGDGNGKALVAKITITTDLGESLLSADVGICVYVVDVDGESILGPGREYIWKGREGMRSQEVNLPMKKVRKLDIVRMCVVSTGDAFIDNFESVLGVDKVRKVESQGGVAPVRSMEIDVRTGQAIGTGLAERVFRNNLAEIHIWEETGESIARHVWYACSGQVRPSLPTDIEQGRWSRIIIIYRISPQSQNFIITTPPHIRDFHLITRPQYPRTRRRLRNSRHNTPPHPSSTNPNPSHRSPGSH
jgi:hypothetical protein